ncbi:GtrA family protein [Kytococcus sp. Marseille-QA3725]
MSSEPPHHTGLRRLIDVLTREVSKFGVIGLLAFIIDAGLYNLLMYGPALSTHATADGALGEHPLTSKVLATATATAFAWLGNRYWTFRHARRSDVAREAVLFVVFNVLGLLIALVCLWFSHYVLDFRSQLADNISGNGVGLVLGTLFRFWAYRTFVFTEELGQEEAARHREDDLGAPTPFDGVDLVTHDDAGLVRPYGVEDDDVLTGEGGPRPVDNAA